MDASMEEQKDPMNMQNQNEESRPEEQEYSFLQETIKDEVGGTARMKRDLYRMIYQGLVFGIVACFGFCAFKPLMEQIFRSDPEQVTIPKEEEEETQEESVEKQEQIQADLDADSYRQMQQSMTTIALEANKAVVEIEAVTGDQKWMTETYDTVNSVTGLIIADNGQELLIFGKIMSMKDVTELQVTFSDGNAYEASLKKKDGNLGFGIYSVKCSDIQKSTWTQIKTASLGSSNSTSRGSTVFALGKQFGYNGGLGFGVVASNRHYKEVADGEYRLICTDIAAASNGTGVLFNLDGEVIAMVDQDISEEDSMNLVTGYGISDIKSVIESLSNGESVPYVGIWGIDVTDEIEAQGIPKGVYVKEVEADSPAMAAGIQIGDIITSIDGEPVTTLSAYHNILMDQETGEKVKIKGQRRGSGSYVDITFSVTIGSIE